MTMADPPVDDVAEWRASTTQIREVVKWIATAFAALGAALIGTTPLSPLASRDNSIGDLVAMCACLAAALVFVGFIVWRCTTMLVPQTTTLPTLDNDPKYGTLGEAIRADPSAFLGAWSADLTNFVQLRDDEYVVLGGLDNALGTCEPAQSAALSAARDKVVNRVEAMGRVSRRLLAVADYYRLRRDLDENRPYLFGAAALAAVAIATFVVLGAASGESDGPDVDKTSAIVRFQGDSAEENQQIVGLKCPSPFDAIVSRTGTVLGRCHR